MRAFVERWWYGREPSLGIDIRDNGIVFADVDRRGNNWWRRVDAPSPHLGERGILSDTRTFASLIHDFISSSPSRIARCAVGLSESLASMYWITLPEDVVGKSEQVRLEAALERAYLRPQDVKGRVYVVNRSSVSSANALLVAAKSADVALLEDAVAAAGLELACLTPRVLAFHHLISLSRIVSNDALFAYCDPAAPSPMFHLFNRSLYHATTREFSEVVKEIERCMNGNDPSSGYASITFIPNGDTESTALLQRLYPSARVITMSDVVIPGIPPLHPEEVAAAALSLWEARPR